MRLLIAVLISIAIFWQHPSHIKNSEVKVAVTKSAGQVRKIATAPIKPVEQEEAPAPQPPAPQTEPTTHEELMASVGISPSDYSAVDYIISHESGWNPNATEPTTLAHGLPQALPYSKTGCGWVDAVCQLSWANQYAIARYGGWWNAQAYWSVHRNW